MCRGSLIQRGKPAALHSARPLAALQRCPAPLPASAQHAGPSSAAHRADISRSDRTLQLDNTAAIKLVYLFRRLRARALPQDVTRLEPASSPATASLLDESRPQRRCRSRPIAGSAFTSAGRTSIDRQARAPRGHPGRDTAFLRL
jgi:hypothetical protein